MKVGGTDISMFRVIDLKKRKTMASIRNLGPGKILCVDTFNRQDNSPIDSLYLFKIFMFQMKWKSALKCITLLEILDQLHVFYCNYILSQIDIQGVH